MGHLRCFYPLFTAVAAVTIGGCADARPSAPTAGLDTNGVRSDEGMFTIPELQTYAESEPVNAAYRGAWARPGRPVGPQSHWPEGVSTTRTASSISARACARFVARVDLPTPPFWFANRDPMDRYRRTRSAPLRARSLREGPEPASRRADGRLSVPR
jgi:hypothetical protein